RSNSASPPAARLRSHSVTFAAASRRFGVISRDIGTPRRSSSSARPAGASRGHPSSPDTQTTSPAGMLPLRPTPITPTPPPRGPPRQVWGNSPQPPTTTQPTETNTRPPETHPSQPHPALNSQLDEPHPRARGRDGSALRLGPVGEGSGGDAFVGLDVARS